MVLAKWDDKYSVRIEELDGHHKQLFNLLNEFYQGLRDGVKEESLIKMVKGLEEYSQFHFSAEEELMKTHDFPGLDEHVRAHNGFIQKVKNYAERLETKQILGSIEITNFIRDWLVNHIMIMDSQYSAHLNSRGVK